VKRVRETREAIEAKQKRERAKIDEYLALTQDVLARVCFRGFLSLLARSDVILSEKE
jgi:hypothetical protein